MMFVNALLLNICQRTSQTLIPCFVIMASPLFAQVDVTFLQLFCMQAYVLIGYNSIPLPGGTGVYEYLYPNVFGIGFPDMTFVLSAMMVSRAISFYISMVITGLYTLVYHAIGIRKIKADSGNAPTAMPDDVDVFSALNSGAVLSELSLANSQDEPATKRRRSKVRAESAVEPDPTVEPIPDTTDNPNIKQDENPKEEKSDDGNN